MKHDYTKIEQAILERIQRSPVTLAPLLYHIDKRYQSDMREEPRPANLESFVNHRLQSLRKRGIVKYTHTDGWIIATPEDRSDRHK